MLCDLEALGSLDRARRTDSLDVSMCSVPSACCVCSVCSVHKSGVLEHNREVNA